MLICICTKFRKLVQILQSNYPELPIKIIRIIRSSPDLRWGLHWVFWKIFIVRAVTPSILVRYTYQLSKTFPFYFLNNQIAHVESQKKRWLIYGSPGVKGLMVSGVWHSFGADYTVTLRYCKCRSYCTLKHPRILNLQFAKFARDWKGGFLTKSSSYS